MRFAALIRAGVLCALLPQLASSKAGDEAATLRDLLEPNGVGAVRVFGVPYPNDVLNGLYYPTTYSANEKMAYKKEDLGKKTELWLALDPNGYWAVQPTATKGTSEVFMVSSQPNLERPEDAPAWQIWEDGGWKVLSAIGCGRCIGEECKEAYEDEKDKLRFACKTDSGVCAFTRENSYAFDTWAHLALAGVVIIMIATCLCNGGSMVARSYMWNTLANTVMVVIGFLVARHVVNFAIIIVFLFVASVTDLFLKNSIAICVILFLFFTVGFFSIHFLSWKCQHSPQRRTIVWRALAPVAAAMGVVAFRRLRSILIDRDVVDDDVEVELVMTLIGLVVLGLYAFIAKLLHENVFNDPPTKGWPEKQEEEHKTALTVVKDQAWRGCEWASTCAGQTKKGDEDELEDLDDEVGKDKWHSWYVEALWGQGVCIGIILAFFLRDIVGSVATSVALSCAAILVSSLIVGLLMQVMRKKGADWVRERPEVLLISATTFCCLTGLVIYGSMWQFLGTTDSDWWGCQCGVAPHVLGILALTFFGLLMVKLLARMHDDDHESNEYGLILLHMGGVYPLEVEIVGMMLGWAWYRLFEGAIEKVTNSIDDRDFEASVYLWDAGWSIALAMVLYSCWYHLLLPRAERRIKHHQDDFESEAKSLDNMPSLRPLVGPPKA